MQSPPFKPLCLRYFTEHYFFLNVDGIERNDFYAFRHSNGVVVVGLADSHFVCDPKYSNAIMVVEDVDAMTSKVHGKRKRGGLHALARSALVQFSVTLPGADEPVVFRLPCPCEGSIFEINSRVITESEGATVGTHRAITDPYGSGFCAIINPPAFARRACSARLPVLGLLQTVHPLPPADIAATMPPTAAHPPPVAAGDVDAGTAAAIGAAAAEVGSWRLPVPPPVADVLQWVADSYSAADADAAAERVAAALPTAKEGTTVSGRAMSKAQQARLRKRAGAPTCAVGAPVEWPTYVRARAACLRDPVSLRIAADFGVATRKESGCDAGGAAGDASAAAAPVAMAVE